jgi:hypothetical protein
VGGVAKKKAIKERDPLEPLLTFNWMALSLLVLGLAWGMLAMLIGRGGILGWGTDWICVTTHGLDFGTAGIPGDLNPHMGISAGASGLRLCTGTPSTEQRWWYSLEQLPGTATGIAVVLTTYLVLRQAQRHGLYSPGIATRIRFLGWFLIAASVLSPTMEVYASHKLWATMADGAMPTEWSPVWLFLFAGIALLSLARIMAVGTAMREDLEGVV